MQHLARAPEALPASRESSQLPQGTSVVRTTRGAMLVADEDKPGCCEQGGCCTYSPPKKVVDESGRVCRINLSYRTRGCCCGDFGGLRSEDVEVMPAEVSELGLSQMTWDHYVNSHDGLYQAQQHRQPFVVCCPVATLLILSIVMIPFLCKLAKPKIMRWDAALREWQSNFNRELHRYGMFIKTQSHCMAWYDRNGKHRVIERWVSIALTPAEANRLALEPHLTGDIENTKCCGGVDEHELCMHP